jgi:hypothetical protein
LSPYTRAEREHEAATALLNDALQRIDTQAWHAPRPDRAWTRADEAAHILLALDFGTRAANGTMQMVVRRSALVSTLSRTLLIPLLLRRGAFPTGGVSPDELDPRRQPQFAAQVSTRESALAALVQASEAAAQAFRAAATEAPTRRIVHAYFGGLPLLTGWRLLSAHTRHHAARLIG